MTEDDKKILTFSRDYGDGSVSRERLLKAFKRSGATIGLFERNPHIFFGTDFIPVGVGEISMSGPHHNYLSRISDLAKNVLKYNEVKEKFGIKSRPYKRTAKPVEFPFSNPPTSP